MSQQNPDFAPEESSEHFGMPWILLFGFIGVLIVGISFIISKELRVGEVIYDIGITTVTLALVDLIILRSLKEFASRPTEREKRLAAAIASVNSALTAAAGTNNEMKKFNIEMGQQLEKWKHQETDDRIKKIERMLEALGEEIDSIRVHVDSEYRDLKNLEKRIMDESSDKK